MIRAIIVEDESVAVRRLKRLLKELSMKVRVVAVFDSVEDVVEGISDIEADLLFLDIHLADGSSFQIFEQIDVQLPIIFVTAYDSYSLQAFKQHSVDYLLKPIDKDDLEGAVAKFQRHFMKQEAPKADYKELIEAIRPTKQKKRFLIQIGQKVRMVGVEEVAFFWVENKATYLVTFGGRMYPIDYSLSQLEKLVNPERFFRVNRQFLICSEAIEEIYYLATTRLKLSLQPKAQVDVLVSIDKIGKFKRWLGG